jgi:hypothetical protein
MTYIGFSTFSTFPLPVLIAHPSTGGRRNRYRESRESRESREGHHISPRKAAMNTPRRRTVGSLVCWSRLREVYHWPECPWAPRIADRNRREAPLWRAARYGRRPCGCCRPPSPEWLAAVLAEWRATRNRGDSLDNDVAKSHYTG